MKHKIGDFILLNQRKEKNYFCPPLPESCVGVRWGSSFPTCMVNEKGTCWCTDNWENILHFWIIHFSLIVQLYFCVCVSLVPTYVGTSQTVRQVSGCQFQVAGCFGSCYLNKLLQFRESTINCFHSWSQWGNGWCTWKQGLQAGEKKTVTLSCSALS